MINFNGLTEVINAIEEKLLNEIGVVKPCGVNILPGKRLGFAKFGGRWRLVIDHGNEVTPLVETGLLIRLMAHFHLRALVDEMFIQKKSMEIEVSNSINRYTEFLNEKHD